MDKKFTAICEEILAKYGSINSTAQSVEQYKNEINALKDNAEEKYNLIVALKEQVDQIAKSCNRTKGEISTLNIDTTLAVNQFNDKYDEIDDFIRQARGAASEINQIKREIKSLDLQSLANNIIHKNTQKYYLEALETFLSKAEYQKSIQTLKTEAQNSVDSLLGTKNTTISAISKLSSDSLNSLNNLKISTKNELALFLSQSRESISRANEEFNEEFRQKTAELKRAKDEANLIINKLEEQSEARGLINLLSRGHFDRCLTLCGLLDSVFLRAMGMIEHYEAAVLKDEILAIKEEVESKKQEILNMKNAAATSAIGAEWNSYLEVI